MAGDEQDVAGSDKSRSTLGLSRRAIVGGLVGAGFASGPGAWAETNGSWIDKVFGASASEGRQDAEKKKPDPLNDLRPNSVPFRSEAMLEAFDSASARLQTVVDKGGWPVIPGTRMIRPEDEDERVPILRRRLAVTGELKDSGSGYDGGLEEAVRRFQESHGLRVSGRVDKPTLAQLNIPAKERLQQLRLNQTRIRELMTGRIEDRYILVNAAAFQLEAVERDEVQLRHRTIVGRVGRETPIVKASIRALNFFPMWHVPDSVATLDLIPKMQKEPDYLGKEKIRVFAGSYNGQEIDPATIDWRTITAQQIKFRQDPGPQDALGLMRIDMPNSEGVYMHDTPMKQLFQQRSRPFSAGCVRVQDVFKLGEWIARNEPGWSEPGRVQAVIDAGQPLDFTLTRQVPVYFTYITAWAEPGGAMQWRPDIYNRDGMAAGAGTVRDENDPPPPSQALAP